MIGEDEMQTKKKQDGNRFAKEGYITRTKRKQKFRGGIKDPDTPEEEQIMI